MDTTIIVLKALGGAAFAVVALVTSIIVAAFILRSFLVVVDLVRAALMRRRIKQIHWFLGRSGV